MLYHREVKWNNNFDKQISSLLKNNNSFVFSRHIREREHYHDCKHNVDLKKLNKIIWEIKKYNPNIKAFECEVDNNHVFKFVVRTEYNNTKDISIVFLEKEDYLIIKTCWLNDKADKHITLNKNKYVSKGGR